MILEQSKISRRQFWETADQSGTVPFCLVTGQDVELVQSEFITPNHPSMAAGCMQRLLLPSWSKLSSPPSFTHRQKVRGYNEP